MTHRSGNSRSRKRKPDHTYKYVQQNEKEGDKAKDEESEEAKKVAENSKEESAGASDEESSSQDPPSKKTKDINDKSDEKKAQTDGEKKAETSEAEEAVKADPYDFLSEADKKLMQTDILEFIKRFAPKFYVPVYKTWTIPKSAVH